MDLPELQDAVQSLEGVASATMRWPDPEGPVLLRVAFEPAAERDRVTEHVLDLVRRAGAVDQQTVEFDRPEPAQAPALSGRERSRPVLIGLNLSDQGLDMNVQVVLEADRRQVTGHADGIAVPGADLRAAAAATLSAIRHLLPDNVRVELEWISVAEAGTVHAARLVQTGVMCLSADRGAEVLYGSAPVRGDARDAAARSTLDALNRRLAQLAGAA